MAYRRDIILIPSARYQSGHCCRREPIDRSHGRSIRARRMLHARRCFISERIIRIKITDYAVSSNGLAQKKKILEILFGAGEISRAAFGLHSIAARRIEIPSFEYFTAD